MRVLQLTEQVTAAMLLAACQGVQLRIRQAELEVTQLSVAVQKTLVEVAEVFSFLEQDRALENTLRHTISLIQSEHWTLYE
jgi:histidine ammonia-lyase